MSRIGLALLVVLAAGAASSEPTRTAEGWPKRPGWAAPGWPGSATETGTALPADDDMIVFTAVFHTGGNPTPVNCAAWTSAEEPLVPTGLASQTDTGWTVFAPHSCGEMHHLYCFEHLVAGARTHVAPAGSGRRPYVADRRRDTILRWPPTSAA